MGSRTIAHGWSRLGGGTGLHRLFTAEMANEISWLLPAALLAVAFGVYLVFRGRLSRGEKAALTMFTGWLLVSGTGVQLHERDGPPVLHRGDGARGRRAGRHRRGVGVAKPGRLGRPRRARGHDRADRPVVGTTSAPQQLWPRMVPVGADRRRGCRSHRRARPRHAQDRRCRGRRRSPGRGRRHGSVLHRHRRHPAPRLDPDSAEEGQRPARQLDGRRSHQSRPGRDPGQYRHRMVGRHQRLTVRGRARDLIGHLGDGYRRVERRPGAHPAVVHRRRAGGEDLVLRRGRTRAVLPGRGATAR